MVTTTLPHEFAVTCDELQVLAKRAGVQALPVVLALTPRYATVTELSDVENRATAALSKRGLITDGAVEPELVSAMRTLERPDREFAMRLMTPDGLARTSLARRGSQTVLARRIGSEVLVRQVGHYVELKDAIQVLMSQLPAAEPAVVSPINAPLETLSEALTGTTDSIAMADRLRAVGCDQQTALTMATVLGGRRAFAEVTYYTLDPEDERVERVSGAVGVFYTKRGRVVSAPSQSPGQQMWATIKAGSSHAIAQSIGQLAELAPNRWEGTQ